MILKQIKCAIFIVIASAFFLFIVSRDIGESSDWEVSYNGLVSYPADRGRIDFELSRLEETDAYTVDKIVFKSKGKDIYALLFLPSAEGKYPAVIMLPGANGPKENHIALGKKMASEGIAFLSVDQRGIGETGGNVNSIEQDYQMFVSGQEPILHLMVYDALRAFDVLRKVDAIDSDRIMFSGESMGGRFAMIAAALEKRANGAVIFSSSGFLASGQEGDKFVKSIDPNSYVPQISPRKLVMFHSANDSVIPATNAEATFSIANEPKHLVYTGDSCDHGYCDWAYSYLIQEISWVLQD